ncbi:sensor histidine kinase [Salidesulfovibrio onnuriiensis]|uniref:sensor histidine kinase n=1 Tax=Salidesulfovibrio onnuriiensis TaxID=2583823 RepID=UPI00164F0391|nr:ATP-binding protein [Salidesulfovibrio onnuriiensis]
MAELLTDFLPPGREDKEALLPLVARFSESLAAKLFDGLPLSAIILNQDRQIVFGNTRFRQLSGARRMMDLVGQRPGEALGCVNAHLQDGGCGTTRFCRQCGAAIAILESFQGTGGVEECLLERRLGEQVESLVLQVFTWPFSFEGHDLILFTALDVSHEKRAREMERLVFHKLLGNASGMIMLANLIEEELGEDMAEYSGHMRSAAKELVGMIRHQQVWSAAEQGRLRVLAELLDPELLMRQALLAATNRESDRELGCVIDCDCENELRTDPALLELVLVALLENAFEAMPSSSLVVFGCRERDGVFVFSVCNEGMPSEDIRNQFFKRAFTTKGEGRGFGLYRAKMLTEYYLGGALRVSCDQNRTTFLVEIPGEFRNGE